MHLPPHLRELAELERELGHHPAPLRRCLAAYGMAPRPSPVWGIGEDPEFGVARLSVPAVVDMMTHAIAMASGIPLRILRADKPSGLRS